jgi:hypothetical protein
MRRKALRTNFKVLAQHLFARNGETTEEKRAKVWKRSFAPKMGNSTSNTSQTV